MSTCNKQVSLFGALAATLIVAGAAAGGPRPGPAVPYDQKPLFNIEDFNPGWIGGIALDGSGPGVQAAADRIIALQCDPPGGWGWPVTCPVTYNNITAPIAMGLMKAYDITGDTATLNAAIAGGDYDLTFTFTNGTPRHGSHAPAFLYRLSGTSYANDPQYSQYAEVGFFDRLTAFSYGDFADDPLYPVDTYGFIARHKTGRSGSLINLRPWDMQYMPWVAGLIGNPHSTGTDGISQQTTFLNDSVLDGLDTLDENIGSDIIGLAGAVHGLALNGTTTFPLINSPNHSAINGISTLCALADVLAGMQNANGAWYWISTLVSPGPTDEDTQVTAYAVMALVAADALSCGPYDTEIAKGRAWLDSIQDASGAFPDPFWGENVEVNGEALSAVTINTLSLNMATTCENSGTVTVTIDIDAMPVNIVGGQFFLEYNTTYLSLDSVDPGGTPFLTEVFECSEDESIPTGCTPTVGEIDFAVGVSPFNDPGSAGPATLAILTFNTVDELCTPTADLVKFRDIQPDPPTRLTDADGNPILPTWVNLGPITIDETDPVITPPSDIDVDADAGVCTAFVTVPTLVVDDPCTGIVSIVNDFNFTSNASGTYLPGPTTVIWTVTDNCGNTSTDSQIVTVSSFNQLVVTVELSPSVVAGPFDRCITFDVDCGGEFSEVITFTGGVGSKTVLVPCGPHTCISARDTLHTLRSTDVSIVDAGTQFTASFTTGTGNELVGGNLNDDNYIDILDFGVFVGEFNFDYTTGDTTCATAYPHADINGSGVADSADYQHISLNFLKASDADCGCTMPMMADRGPITQISVRALRRRGMEDLIKADLNHDGWLDMRDMQAFAAGARPE